MNILFITPSIPSSLHRIRSLNLIKYLCRSHTVYLLSLTQRRQTEIRELGRYCRQVQFVYQSPIQSIANCMRWICSRMPLEVAYCHNASMREAIQGMIRRYPIDIIYIKRLRSAQFVSLDTGLPRIVDTTDAMSLYYERAKRAVAWYRKPFFWAEAAKYRVYERTLLRQFQDWIVCSRIDLAYLRDLAPDATRLWLVPNGVDTEVFSPTMAEAERNTLLLSGLMDKVVNVEAVEYFVRDIFPRILKAIPDVRLYIVGPKPTASIRRLHGGGVLVTGEVPDIRHYIERSQVVVCPIKTGAGTRNKILQAWAVGRPVVTTARGVEGLEGSDGDHFLVANGASEFAEQTIGLLMDHKRQIQLAANGLALVREKYAMNVIAGQLNDLLAKVQQRRDGP